MDPGSDGHTQFAYYYEHTCSFLPVLIFKKPYTCRLRCIGFLARLYLCVKLDERHQSAPKTGYVLKPFMAYYQRTCSHAL